MTYNFSTYNSQCSQLGKVEIRGGSGNCIHGIQIQRKGGPGVRSHQKQKLEHKNFYHREIEEIHWIAPVLVKTKYN